MRRLILLCALGVLLALVPTEIRTEAQTVCPGVDGDVIMMGKETLSVSSTAVSFTVSNYRSGIQTARFATFSTETDAVRYWEDGTAPTSSVGHLVPAGSTGIICGINQIQRFKAIRVTTDAKMVASFYRLNR